MPQLYVIHAASKIAIVTQIVVLRENWIMYVVSPFFLCVKTPISRSRRRHRIVNLLMSLIKPTASHSIKESHFCVFLKDLIWLV